MLKNVKISPYRFLRLKNYRPVGSVRPFFVNRQTLPFSTVNKENTNCSFGSEGCHFFFAGFLCGVDGLPAWPVFIPPYWYFAFFSEGFKIYIWKENYRFLTTRTYQRGDCFFFFFFFIFNKWSHYLETAHQSFVDAHHAASIVELSAIIRSRK